MPQVDSELFDAGQFQAELSLKASPIAAFKKFIRAANATLDARFLAGRSVRRLVEDRAWFIDQMLIAAWSRFSWPDDGIALLAVGGYGRGELHPHSDIDLLILLAEEEQERFRDSIEGFLTLLWDVGLAVGQSVRSLRECTTEALADLTVITNLMESRTLAGPEHLRQAMLAATSVEHLWPGRAFYLAKRAEQSARHAKYNDTEYNLEPNVKGSPGGLRDIQTLLWIARRQFGTLNLQALVGQGFLTESECSLLISAQEYLWKVRYALHMLAGRPEDRLLFDHQRRIANLLGYEDNDAKLAVERFMQKYYRVVMDVSQLSDVVMQHFEEVNLRDEQLPAAVTPLNNRFQIRNGYLEVVHPQVFLRTPFALMELFVLLAQNPAIKGPSAGTIRLLRDSRHLIDDAFRQDIRNTSLFIELLKSESGIHRNLRRMNRYGLLGLYLPEFGQIVGQMQHDLFHIYTVDAHTLNLIKHLRKMSYDVLAEKYPLATRVIHKLPKPELIYIAGLYHDIAKGRGGDHSELGAEDVEAFGRRHQLPEWDTRLVSWLVRNHLVMSTTAQRKDLSDPQVIHDFALTVGDHTHLDYLYVLTVADITATNPSLWNSWRATLLRQLYTETKRALRRGLGHPVNREEQIRSTQQSALDTLMRRGIDADDAEQLWSQLGDTYFLRHTALDVAWHTEAILGHGDTAEPLVLIRETTQRDSEGGTQIFIYAADQHDFFAVTVAVMDQLNLNIQDARIITSTSQFTLDTYIVLDTDGGSIGNNPARIAQIRGGLIEALKHPEEYPSIINRRVTRQLKHFAFSPQVNIYTDTTRSASLIELTAPDRPGLLARVGRIFLDFDLSVLNAKIATLGERVEDVFYVTDADGRPLADPGLCSALQQALIKQLGEPDSQTPLSRISI